MDSINAKNTNYCMHAGGMIEGNMLTNTREAFDYWYSRGMNNFEFDVCRTEDGEYVTCHDFNTESFIKHGITDIPNVCTAHWFVSQNIYFNGKGPFHAMTLREVLSYLSIDKTHRVMLDPKDFTFEGTCLLIKYIHDIKKDFYVIAKNQIVVELYNRDMITAADLFPDEVNYQYCVDDDIQQGNSEELRNLSASELIGFLQNHNISIVSYPWKQAVENLHLLKLLSDNNFLIYSRTRNNIFHELLKKTNVDVNIVDEILTEEQYQELLPYKNSYMKKYKKQIDEIFKERA